MKKFKKLIARVLCITPALVIIGGTIITFAQEAATRCIYPAWAGAPEMPSVLLSKIK